MEAIVIGSGVAGHAAMRRLVQAGVKAVCLESAERIGGRVTCLPFGEDTVDLGATYIEGKEGDIFYDLAKPLGLLDVNSVPPTTKYFLTNGETVSNSNVDRFVHSINTHLKEVYKNDSRTIVEYLDELIQTDENLKSNQLTPSILDWLIKSKGYGGIIDPKMGKSLKSLDDRNFKQAKWYTWKSPGMSVLFDLLQDKLPDSSKQIPMDIKLFKEVETIKWKNNDGLVKVFCKDGSEYEAKTVISTLTIGVLKEKSIFDPPLPKDKSELINSYGMYIIDKIFIEFTAPWWEPGANYNLIWRPEDRDFFSGNEAWISGVYSLTSVARQKNVLIAWICGEEAKLMEQLTDDDVRRGIEKLLKFLFKDQVTDVKKTLRTKWNKNRFERGAYAYRSVLTEEIGGGNRAELSDPLLVDGFPVVCFAGDATSLQSPGLACGAAESGFREADRVIKALRK